MRKDVEFVENAVDKMNKLSAKKQMDWFSRNG